MTLFVYKNGFVGEMVDITPAKTSGIIDLIYSNETNQDWIIDIPEKELYSVFYKLVGSRPIGVWILSHKGSKGFGIRQDTIMNMLIDRVANKECKYDINMFFGDLELSDENEWTVEKNPNFKKIQNLSPSEFFFKWVNSYPDSEGLDPKQDILKYLVLMFGNDAKPNNPLVSNENYNPRINDVSNESIIDSIVRLNEWFLNFQLRLDAKVFNYFFNVEKRAAKLAVKLNGLTGEPKDGSVWKPGANDKFISVDGKIATFKDVKKTTDFFKKVLDSQHEFIINQDKLLDNKISYLSDLDSTGLDDGLKNIVDELVNNFDRVVNWKTIDDIYTKKRITSDPNKTVEITDVLVGDYFFYKAESKINVKDTYDLIKKLGSIDVGVIDNKPKMINPLFNTTKVMSLDEMKKCTKIVLEACHLVEKSKFYSNKVKNASSNIIKNLKKLLNLSNDELTTKLIKAYIKRLKETLYEPYGTCASRIHYTYAELINYMEKCSKQYK